MTRQPDPFGEGEPELPGVENTPAAHRADPDELRVELLGVLAKVRAAQSFPWDARRTVYWRTVFLQMMSGLPEAELRYRASSSRRKSCGSKRPGVSSLQTF
jgi:hypothetical protein